MHWTGDSVLSDLYVRPKSHKAKTMVENRRSQRIDLSVSVRPETQTEGPQFCESTKTLVVSAHGALVALKDMVAPKQKLLLQNTVSETARVSRGLRESRTDWDRDGCS